MAITERKFSDLKKGMVMVDSDKEEWTVVSDASCNLGSSIVCVWTRAEAYSGGAMELCWMNLGEGNTGIMDEEIALVMELNHPNAFIKK